VATRAVAADLAAGAPSNTRVINVSGHLVLVRNLKGPGLLINSGPRVSAGHEWGDGGNWVPRGPGLVAQRADRAASRAAPDLADDVLGAVGQVEPGEPQNRPPVPTNSFCSTRSRWKRSGK